MRNVIPATVFRISTIPLPVCTFVTHVHCSTEPVSHFPRGKHENPISLNRKTFLFIVSFYRRENLRQRKNVISQHTSKILQINTRLLLYVYIIVFTLFYREIIICNFSQIFKNRKNTRSGAVADNAIFFARELIKCGGLGEKRLAQLFPFYDVLSRVSKRVSISRHS